MPSTGREVNGSDRHTSPPAAAMRRRSPKRCVNQRPLLVGSTERLRQQRRLCVRRLVARLVAGLQCGGAAPRNSSIFPLKKIVVSLTVSRR